MEALIVLLSGFVGVFFTHRAFVAFVIGYLRAKREIANGGEYDVGPVQLLHHAVLIVLGLLPLGYALIRFVHWVWNNSLVD